MPFYTAFRYGEAVGNLRSGKPVKNQQKYFRFSRGKAHIHDCGLLASHIQTGSNHLHGGVAPRPFS